VGAGLSSRDEFSKGQGIEAAIFLEIHIRISTRFSAELQASTLLAAGKLCSMPDRFVVPSGMKESAPRSRTNL
jgi:hypothetical protein